MNTLSPTGRRSHRACAAWLWAGTIAAILSLVGIRADAAPPSLGTDSQACQACHDKPDLAMKTQDGKPWSLHVPTEAYLASMHGKADCSDCHDDIDGDKHAKDKPAVKSRRDYSLALNEACKTCHKKNVALFKDSVHAAMLKEGSTQAPVCSDCHDVHRLQSAKLPTPVAETPCLKCHAEIGQAYSADVHGLRRIATGKPAPICADCHHAHAIHAAASDDGLKDACLGCHRDAVAQHQGWLPNAQHHFDTISCPVCHAPAAERRVNLRMYDKHAKLPLAEPSGVPRFERLATVADRQGQGLDERALWSLLQEFNRGGAPGDVILRGRLEVRKGVMAHQLAKKSEALRDCDGCHREGAQAFQSVVLTIAGPDGRPLRHGVDKQVLSSLASIDSVRGFYAIGANRIKLLDLLLVLVVVGSVGGVLAHMTIKWATRRMRAKIAAEHDTPQ